MKLEDAIHELDGLPGEATLFVERMRGQFLPESRTVILELTDEEFGMPATDVARRRAPGTEYFLAAHLVLNMVKDWESDHGRNAESRARLLAQRHKFWRKFYLQGSPCSVHCVGEYRGVSHA